MTDEYRRRLARHEAAAEPIAREDGVELFSPFGPLIARLRAPDALVERLNRYADSRAEDHFSVPAAAFAEGGEQSLSALTGSWILRYAALAGEREGRRVRFENFWVLRHVAGTFSPVHFHSGDVSGVLYLRVPDSIDNQAAEEQKSYISARRAGYITFFIGGKQRFSKSLASFKPRVGDFYLFPGWLLHAVEPFEGQGERRSMSFNAFVD
jgi:hypothetical protein